MTTYIALLRAVNVGGTGKLPMQDLKTLCEQQGFAKVRTYIASGYFIGGRAVTADPIGDVVVVSQRKSIAVLLFEHACIFTKSRGCHQGTLAGVFAADSAIQRAHEPDSDSLVASILFGFYEAEQTTDPDIDVGQQVFAAIAREWCDFDMSGAHVR